MEKKYRLEFNEKQQNFHLDNFTHEENTHGWFTIFESITGLEFKIYESFISRVPKEKLTKQYLLKCAEELKAFKKNLLKHNLTIEPLK